MPMRRKKSIRLNGSSLISTINTILNDKTLDESQRRLSMLACYGKSLESPKREIRRRFDIDQDGSRTAGSISRLIDQLIRIMWGAATKVYPVANLTSGERLSVVAVGGYGRGRLAPSSDIDLLFLIPYKMTPHSEQLIEHILYMLWDLDFKVGQATRSLDDCMRLSLQDISVRTSVLESRFICGDRNLFSKLLRYFRSRVVKGTKTDFVEAKLVERDQRHRRLGGSRYVLEPNIKDGKGGLRDLHTLFWIGKYLHGAGTAEKLAKHQILTKQEARRFSKAEKYLWSLRCQIHYLVGRSEERLIFDIQPAVAELMGYRNRSGARAVERFMKHYFIVAKEVGNLTRIFCAVLEARHHRRLSQNVHRFGASIEGFLLDRGRLNIAASNHFERNPVDLIRLFEVSGRTDIDIHPGALQTVGRNLGLIDASLREDREANLSFRRILAAQARPDTTLRRMNEVGVLGRFLPEFGRVVAQMQYDMYHVYTTDEHIILAIGVLSQIERQILVNRHPLASREIKNIISRDVLFLAMFLHDIGKGRGGNHPKIGAEIASRLGPRLGFSAEETETTAWLVRNHLIFSDVAFRRDMDDPKTISDLVSIIKSRERLRLLLCMTVADICAVGPGVWNEWKATLLRDLYRRADDLMSSGLLTESRGSKVGAVKDELRGRLVTWSPKKINLYLDSAEHSYWLAYNIDQLEGHAELIREVDRLGDRVGLQVSVEKKLSVSVLTIYGQDQLGLFRRISGALLSSGANVLDAKVSTLRNGMILNTFWFQNTIDEAFDDEVRLQRLKTKVRSAVLGNAEDCHAPTSNILPTRRSGAFSVTSRVLIDNNASNTHTVLEINGLDRPGLLYDVTHALMLSDLQISAAKVSTYGEQVVDVFYIKDKYGVKIWHPVRLAQVRSALLLAMESGSTNV